MSDDPIEPIGQPREAKHPRVRKTLKPFLAGMATVIPVLATGWIVVLVFRLLHKIGLAIINGFLKSLNENSFFPTGAFFEGTFLTLLLGMFVII